MRRQVKHSETACQVNTNRVPKLVERKDVRIVLIVSPAMLAMRTLLSQQCRHAPNDVESPVSVLRITELGLSNRPFPGGSLVLHGAVVSFGSPDVTGFELVDQVQNQCERRGSNISWLLKEIHNDDSMDFGADIVDTFHQEVPDTTESMDIAPWSASNGNRRLSVTRRGSQASIAARRESVVSVASFLSLYRAWASEQPGGEEDLVDGWNTASSESV